MRVLSVRFKSSIPFEELHGPWLDVAPEIASQPGLISKVWIHEDDLLGGIYLFRDQGSLDAYASGTIVAAILGTPEFSDFRVEQYEASEDLSAITHAIPTTVVSA